MSIEKMFTPSAEAMKKVEIIARQSEKVAKVAPVSEHSCTTCWGGWCANGITG